MRVVVVKVLFVAALVSTICARRARGIEVQRVRVMAAKNNVSGCLVFGDSSVDPGNNNRLANAPKADFPPYGRDFFQGRPTGRFTNGRLATDFIAEAFGKTNVVPAFLDPNLSKEDLMLGVSFASAGSGYDDLTANLSNALPVWKQLEYFMHYKIHLNKEVGEREAKHTITNAIFVLSMGTNDFLLNYYFEDTRSKQYTVQQYQDYLISRMSYNVKIMHRLGARRLAAVGLPPLGCLPIVRALKGITECDDDLNKVAFSFNSKLKQELQTLMPSLGMRITYIDIYTSIARAIRNPKRYGFEETSKGCCGSGVIESGETCKGMSTCADPSKYLFWDAVHPTERMYFYLAAKALDSVAHILV